MWIRPAPLLLLLQGRLDVRLTRAINWDLSRGKKGQKRPKKEEIEELKLLRPPPARDQTVCILTAPGLGSKPEIRHFNRKPTDIQIQLVHFRSNTIIPFFLDKPEIAL